MKILFVASEVNPLAKVGGLADVVGSLPKALEEMGHEVRLAMPQYGCIDTSVFPAHPVKNTEISFMGRQEKISLQLTQLGDVPVYLVGNHRHFGDYARVYNGHDDVERFVIFCRSVFELLSHLGWTPDVVHCHDWHTAMLVAWLKQARYPGGLIFTIHNLVYQGYFDESFLDRAGIAGFWQDLPPGIPRPPLNLMSQGIIRADLITTVSETYAKEILTPEHGAGLEQFLAYRARDLIGIVNGIDYNEYNPSTDPYIAANFDAKSAPKRLANKLAIQKRTGLTQDAAVPLIGLVQRLEEQKGIEILSRAIEPLCHETRAQMVMLGSGGEYYQNLLRKAVERHPDRIALIVAFDNALAHQIYAGCDMFLMPSRFEPCGLGQLIAMRYGAVPVVRHTGGLVDTVPELSADMTTGNGFVFRDYTPEALVRAVKQALAAYEHRARWLKVIERIMGLDYSWRTSASKYVAAYERALAMKTSARK